MVQVSVVEIESEDFHPLNGVLTENQVVHVQ